MAFFDKLSETLVNASNNVSQKAKDLSETAKLTMDIHAKEDQLQKMYAEIGKKYFEAHKDDTDDEQMVQVKEALIAIENMKKELLELKGAKVCPRCGEEVKATDIYCKSCGAKIEEDDIVVDAVVREAPEETSADEEAEVTIKKETTEEVFED